MASFPSTPFGRPGFDAQASFVADLTRRSCELARQLGELNMRLTQQLVEDTAEASRQILACTNPAQALTAAANAAQPALEHLYSYQQRLAGLFTGMQPASPRSTPHQHSAGRGGHDSLAGGDPLTNASRADTIAGAAGYAH
ncbi:TIGR01841 family phasin [Massilia sp. PAMC28688]|uniref:TIGR01841 family phasin n=1 Tax=Massilia sp. PAMC28688 TaxID=2861283 RepID=UPI001C63400A|nr:TIGR01841 family phasin [Massilia sp. PAMC28688]QYF93763.1 TIGR01841 family phasin [Massilia sp. PAMC28688]